MENSADFFEKIFQGHPYVRLFLYNRTMAVKEPLIKYANKMRPKP